MNKHHIVWGVLGAGVVAGAIYFAPHTPQDRATVPVATPTSTFTTQKYPAGKYPAGILPDPNKTPGATNPNINQGNIAQNICAGSSWSTKSVRPRASYTTALKIRQLAAGYTVRGDTNTKHYEEDHLVSLELGGNPNSEQNLWPESYLTVLDKALMGAHQKDSVENWLHKEVCAGTISLARAQQIITEDWVMCYMDYKNKQDCK